MNMIEEQNNIWQALYNRQLPCVSQYTCQEYLEGLAILNRTISKINLIM